MSLDFWFPTVIYRHDLTPPKDVESEIKKYFDDLSDKLSYLFLHQIEQRYIYLEK